MHSYSIHDYERIRILKNGFVPANTNAFVFVLNTNVIQSGEFECIRQTIEETPFVSFRLVLFTFIAFLSDSFDSRVSLSVCCCGCFSTCAILFCFYLIKQKMVNTQHTERITSQVVFGALTLSLHCLKGNGCLRAPIER